MWFIYNKYRKQWLTDADFIIGVGEHTDLLSQASRYETAAEAGNQCVDISDTVVFIHLDNLKVQNAEDVLPDSETAEI